MDDGRQARDILLVWNKHHHDSIRKLARANSTDIGVPSAAVDQDVIKSFSVIRRPLHLEVLEHQITLLMLIQVLPINGLKMLGYRWAE